VPQNFRSLYRFATVLALLGAGTVFVFGQVLLKPQGDTAQILAVKGLTARTVIENGFATTQLNFTFLNTVNQPIEAEFIYAAPDGAVVTDFAYWFGDEKVVARVAEKERAAAIYKHITTRMRDPALIELVGKKTFRAKIFPVMPNADLKVEIKLVQALQKRDGHYTFVLPIKLAENQQYENLDAQVDVLDDGVTVALLDNIGLSRERIESGTRLKLHGQKYRATKDLRVSIRREADPLEVFSYSARSGGSAGFFVLALTPGKDVRNARIRFTGARVSEVLPRKLRNLKANQTVLIVGRYSGAGEATLRLSGDKYDEKFGVSLAGRTVANNLATKLWAWEQIQALQTSQKNRRKVIALSERFTMPSKFTSWIAIPAAERERYRHEKAMAEAQVAAQRMADLTIAGKQNSREYKDFDEQLRRAAKVLGMDPSNLKSQALRQHLSEQASEVADSMVPFIVRGDTGSEAYKRLSRRLASTAKKVNMDEQSLLSSRLYAHGVKAAQVIALHEIVGGPSSAEARDSEVLLKRLSLWLDQADLVAQARSRALHQQFGEQAAEIAKGVDRSNEMKNLESYAEKHGLNAEYLRKSAFSDYASEVAEDLVPLEESGGDEKRRAELAARLSDLERLGGLPVGTAMERAREGYWYDQINTSTEKIVRMLREEAPDSKDVAEQLETLKTLKAKFPEAQAYGYWPYEVAEKFWIGVDEGAYRGVSQEQLHQVLLGLCESPEELRNALAYSKGGLRDRYYSYRLEEHRTMRSETKLAEAKARYEQALAVHPDLANHIVAKQGRIGEQVRNTLADEYRKTKPDPQTISKTEKDFKTTLGGSKPSDYIDAWLETIRVEITLDKLQDQNSADPEIVKQIAELEAQRKQLHARMGDPLATAAFPQSARKVHAVMPDGTFKPMFWNPSTKLWQLRFDVPGYATEGEYVILTYGTLPGGKVVSGEFKYVVDVTPPKAEGSAVHVDGKLRIEVAGDADIARVVVVTPWGERITLRRLPGTNKFFALIDAQAVDGVVKVYVTDKAHNRSELEVRITRP
jgi:hypothetical protein